MPTLRTDFPIRSTSLLLTNLLIDSVFFNTSTPSVPSMSFTISVGAKLSYEVNKEFISDVIELDEEPKKKKASITIYVVTKGDTLWSLAKKYNTTVDAIVKMNSIENPDSIEIGDKLIIPGRAIF